MGNKAGWIVAGVLVLAVGTFVGYNIYQSFADPEPSDPTSATTGVGMLDFKQITADPALVLGTKPSAGGNAADDYVKAIEVYKANKDALKKVCTVDVVDDFWEGKKKLQDSEVELLKQIDQQVAAGAAKEKMEFCLVHTPKEFRVGWTFAPGVGLSRVAGCEEALAADLYIRKEYDQAEQVLNHLFALGLHLVNERTRASMTQAGMIAQSQAVRKLGVICRARGEAGKAKLENLVKYNEGLNAFLYSFDAKTNVVNSGKMEPGDVFNVVGSTQDPDKFKGDKDLSWRVQGILALGRLKFGSMKITESDPGKATALAEANRKYAQKLITQSLASKDPAEAAAAAAAQAFEKKDLDTVLNDVSAEE
jgi:hypothetical protein